MTHDVNPFEPWRPPGYVPPERNDSGPFPEPPHGQPLPPPGPSWEEYRRPQLRPDQRGGLALLVGGLFVGVLTGGLAWLGMNHVPRVFLAALAVGLGSAAGLSLARNRRWAVRLGWFGGGLVVAGLVWLFVPTTGGINLWSAYRGLDELRALPPREFTRYVDGGAQREELVREFPTFADDVRAAEREWARRSADEAVREAEGLLAGDPDQASAGLQQAAVLLGWAGHHAVAQTQLQDARRKAVLARLQKAEAEMEADLARGQPGAVAATGRRWAAELQGEAEACGAWDEVRGRLQDLRRRAVQARLEAARRETAGLLKQDRFQAVAAAGERLWQDMGDEAKAVGMADELQRFRQGCGVFGDLARQAKKPDPK
jgi:hypothetical protein